MHPTVIGSFKIERELGRGGMGVVYLARDTKLDRKVAIKALPPDFSGDPGRLARFQREARVLASLNHPGVASIYGLEEVASEHYLVLEYIEGESLATRLSRGPLPLDEALEIAKQVAEAVEAAHEKGIVHRDLKPGNVMLRPDGAVKVLDFGLARASDESPSSSGSVFHPESPTVTSPAMPVNSPTIAGAILGTAGYMSPEQARGKFVDKRSDIFSFGCVLYEMLTGAQPFRGETVTDSLGATLHRDVEWGLLPPGTPPIVRQLLKRCLNKNKHDRLHDIGDARITIADAIAGVDESFVVGPTTGAQARRGWMGIAAGCLVAAALVGATWFTATRFSRPLGPPPRPAKLVIPSRASEYSQAGPGIISPDGRHIVFGARSTDKNQWMLWIRALDSLDAKPLAETGGANGQFWSWDSRNVAFHADGKLWAIDAISGGARRLIAVEPDNYGASWGRDGVIILATTEGNALLVKIPESGGSAEVLTEKTKGSLKKFHVFPMLLPDGERFLYLEVEFDPDQEVRTGRLFAGRLGSREHIEIGKLISRFWYVDPGWLVFVEEGTIRAVPFDSELQRISGEAVTIADGVNYFKAYGEASLSVAADGTIVFQPPEEGSQHVWFGVDGTRQESFGAQGSFSGFRISPDGNQVALGVSDRRTGASDIWLHGVNRPGTTRLTTDARWEGWPLWSRDGSTVYFSWDRSNGPEIFSIPADGSGEINEVYGRDSDGDIWFASDVTPDGKSLLASGSVDERGRDFRVVNLDGGNSAAPLRSTPSDENSGRFSPDGKWLAYDSDESGRREVYLAAYPGPGPRVQVSDSGRQAIWSPSGDRLYYLRRNEIDQTGAGASGGTAVMVVDLEKPEAYRSPPTPRVLFKTPELIDGLDISPDGQRFLALLAPTETPPNIVILNGLPER